MLFDYLFLESTSQVAMLAAIVFIAGIVRGCIGFGLSALIIASTSFWLEIKYVVVMVIILEVIASLFMLKKVKSEVDYKLLKMLTIGGVLTTLLGVWLLANINSVLHQLLLTIYLVFIVIVILSKFEFKGPISDLRLFLIGAIAGFYNGFAGMGGIFVASMLTSSKIQVRNTRATMVVYFFLTEAVFFISAYLNGLLSTKIFTTGLALTIPMLLGIYVGSKLFHILSEKELKKGVLIALLILSIIGLIKVLFS